MTDEEYRKAHPENFEAEVTLASLLAKNREYNMEQLQKDVSLLNKYMNQAVKDKVIALRQLENFVCESTTQPFAEIALRVMRAVDKLESQVDRVSLKMTAIINNLEQVVGPEHINEFVPIEHFTSIGIHDFQLKLNERERSFFESVFIQQGKVTRDAMSEKQYKWMNGIVKRVLGVRFDEVLFIANSEDGSLNDDFELDDD
jgi:hypothetical protein